MSSLNTVQYLLDNYHHVDWLYGNLYTVTKFDKEENLVSGVYDIRNSRFIVELDKQHISVAPQSHLFIRNFRTGKSQMMCTLRSKVVLEEEQCSLEYVWSPLSNFEICLVKRVSKDVSKTGKLFGVFNTLPSSLKIPSTYSSIQPLHSQDNKYYLVGNPKSELIGLLDSVSGRMILEMVYDDITNHSGFLPKNQVIVTKGVYVGLFDLKSMSWLIDLEPACIKLMGNNLYLLTTHSEQHLIQL